MRRRKAAVADARTASLELPGWAWQQGNNQLWVLGTATRGQGYTLKELGAAYRGIKSQVSRSVDRRYVRISPDRAYGLISDTSLAIDMDPNAMVLSGRALTTVQFHVRLDGDSFRIQIGGVFTANGQNCFCFLNSQDLRSTKFFPLPKP